MSSFSAVSKRIFASKYSLESSRRDLHNAVLCTALESQNFRQNFRRTTATRLLETGWRDQQGLNLPDVSCRVEGLTTTPSWEIYSSMRRQREGSPAALSTSFPPIVHDHLPKRLQKLCGESRIRRSSSQFYDVLS